MVAGSNPAGCTNSLPRLFILYCAMNIVIFGPPGAGKGTQAEKISNQYCLSILASGQLIREEIASSSQLGLQIKEVVERGDLVPDELTNKLIKNRVETIDNGGFLFDGFPRTIGQATTLNEWLKEKGEKLSFAINLQVEDNELVHRLLQRHRSDDSDEVLIRHRLEIYQTETKHLIDFYRQQGILVQIDGMGTIEEVFGRIIEKIS